MSKHVPNIREFRSNIAKLKKAGLVSQYIDARSVNPTPRLTRKITIYDDYLSGKVTPVKLTPSELSKYKALGYQTTKTMGGQPAVFMPHAAGETVSKSRGKHQTITIKNKTAGIRYVQLPVQYHTLPQWFRDIKKRADVIDLMKNNKAWWSFRFHGYNTRMTFETIEHLIDEFEKYTSVEQVIDSRPGAKRQEDMNEVYRNLEIVIVEDTKAWIAEKTAAIAAARKKYKRSKKHLEKRRERESQPDYQEANRLRQAAFRAKLKGSKLKAYKKAAVKRAKKSANKKKKAK